MKRDCGTPVRVTCKFGVRVLSKQKVHPVPFFVKRQHFYKVAGLAINFMPFQQCAVDVLNLSKLSPANRLQGVMCRLAALLSVFVLKWLCAYTMARVLLQGRGPAMERGGGHCEVLCYEQTLVVA